MAMSAQKRLWQMPETVLRECCSVFVAISSVFLLKRLLAPVVTRCNYSDPTVQTVSELIGFERQLSSKAMVWTPPPLNGI